MSLDSNLSLDFLKKDNETLKNNGQDSSAGISSPKAFEEVSITQNSDGTWTKSSTKKDSQVKKDNEARVDESKQYSDEVSALENLAKISDDKIISIATQINEKKQLIFDKITEAIGAGCSVGIGTSGVTAIVNGVTIGVGVTITNDYPYIKKYGGLDDPTNSVPFNSDDTVILTSSNSGKGYFSGFTENGGSSVGIYRTVFNDPLSPATPSTICADRTAEIITLANEINTLRGQIDNALISDTNEVKDRKTTSEVFVWGYGSREHKVQDQIDNNTSVINAIEGQSAY
jgi:hypothetical protein